MNSNTYAPIALFAYNRIDHLSKTVDALRENTLASVSELYIFSDGARSPQDQIQVNHVRKFLKTITGFKKIHLIEAQANQGLANSIISGVTQLTDNFGKVIVLEDDIVTSKQFLQFMNDALNFYESEPRVMHISGYMFPIKNSADTETFFIVPTTCWGWGTWKRSWSRFNRDIQSIIPQFSEEMIHDFNLNDSYDYFNQLVLNQKGILKTWAIFWHASVYLSKGLSLHPAQSYCFNIGHDGTGEHCSINNDFDVELSQTLVTQFETEIEESIIFRKKMEEFLIGLKPTLFSRVKRKLKRLGF